MKTHFRRFLQGTLLLFSLPFIAPLVLAQPENGNLQIHFMHVGQGDGALVVSPQGETVLFDSGDRNHDELPVSYLQQLGVAQIDYHIASHYHDDHIGCVPQVLSAYPLQKVAFDRGGSYKSKTFTNYTNTVRDLRRTAVEGAFITLDSGTANPVRIEFVALNGNGVPNAKDENDRSLVCVLRFGQFDAVFGGDLSGQNHGNYKDIETSVAPKVGQVEVYKVNHHGSRHSSNNAWLTNTQPKIGVISCGVNNGYDHPHPFCLARLHDHSVRTYWTSAGDGVASPLAGIDKIGGNIIVQVPPQSSTFTVTYGGTNTDTYTVWNPLEGPTTPATEFAWSTKSQVYHFADCFYVNNINPDNLERGSSPPEGKRIHLGCPK